MSNRIICWFSCGAASAYATYLAAEKYGINNIEAIYCKVIEEHPDNLRFLNDFQNRTGIKIKTIVSEKYEGSIYKVFEARRFIKGPNGAPCTTILKKDIRKAYQRPTDTQIFGYTSEERNRMDRFIDSNNDVVTDFILYDNGITKLKCLEFLGSINIEIPMMYKLGYSNANCRGCVKGGMGYWNKIRKDFPDMFDKMAKLERKLNYSINKDKGGNVFLDVMDPTRGHLLKDAPLPCGFTCEMKDDDNV